MAESNKMKEMPVNKLMVQMGIPMILSMAPQRAMMWQLTMLCWMR